MKETFYFSHDYNASQDAKILNMRSVLGWEGYGLYWQLVERLAEANGKLSFEDIKGISFACCVDESKLISLINDFSLFEKDNTHFWSKRLFEHLKKREKLSKDRAKIGRIGGQAKAKQLLSKSQAKVWQNVAKERKGKESKGKEISISKDIEQSYGREDINKLLKEFETTMGFPSASNKDRIFATHLIKNYTPEQLTAMIKFCAEDGYVRVGSLEKLWFKRGDIIAGIKASFNKKNNIVIAQ